MNISTTEQELRMKAARSAFASVRLAGLEPSQELATLFAAWADGTEPLNAIRDSLIEQWREE